MSFPAMPVSRWLRLLALPAVLVALATTACAPAAPSAGEVRVATPTAPAASAPTTAPIATTPPASATPTVAATAATPAGDPVVDGVRLALVEGASEARFRAREQLAGQSLPNEAVGRTRAVTGSLVLRSDGTIVAEQSKFTVDLRTLQSDQSRRDNYIKRNTLQTDQFPYAEFVPREIRGLPDTLPSEGQVTFELLGDLTVRGVSRPVTWDVTAEVQPDGVAGTAVTQVRLEDFGMQRPTVGPVLSIEETLVLEVDFQAVREG